MVGQKEKMAAFEFVEPEYARDVIEKRRGNVDVAPLLEPRIPSQTDPREDRNLLAPQPRCPTTLPERQSDLEWRDPFTMPTEEVGEFGASAIEPGIHDHYSK